jgi:hypothetical protein
MRSSFTENVKVFEVIHRHLKLIIRKFNLPKKIWLIDMNRKLSEEISGSLHHSPRRKISQVLIRLSIAFMISFTYQIIRINTFRVKAI